MRNIVKHLLSGCVTVLVLLLCNSCLEERISSDYDGVTDNETPSEDAYFSMSIDFGSIKKTLTRSVAIPQYDAGTPEENYVEKVRVLLYAFDSYYYTTTVVYAFDYNIRTRDSSDPLPLPGDPDQVGFTEYDVTTERYLYSSDDDYSFVTFARKVKRQLYTVVVVVNPPADMYTYTQKGGPYEYFYDQYGWATDGVASVDAADLRNRANSGWAADDYFLMTNHQGGFTMTPDKLQETEDAANEYPVKIKVSRAVAKVSVLPENTNLIPVTPVGANVTNLAWQLDITNKKSYRMRNMTYMLTDSGEMGAKEEYFQDDNQDDYFERELERRKYYYAKDPNFGYMDEYPYRHFSSFNGSNLTDRIAEFNYLEHTGGTNLTPTLAGSFGEWEYCLENTVYPEDTYDDVITRVVVSCNYIPQLFAVGESYFMFDTYIFDVETMRDFVNGTGTLPDGLAQAILDAGITAGNFNTMISGAFETAGIKYFHNGINYYAIKIRHSNNSNNDDHSYGYYGVVRNNHYEITVTGIQGPGAPTVSEPEQGNMASKINMLPWTERKHSTVL